MISSKQTIIIICVILGLLSLRLSFADKIVYVNDNVELDKAISEVQPGQTIVLSKGQYSGDINISNLKGMPGNEIVIRGLDKENKPEILGGDFGLRLTDCSYIILKNIVVKESKYNGINIDDGGNYATPAHHIILDNIDVFRIGKKGNHDGIKLSGVDKFDIVRCQVKGWGGSAVDMVGCHEGRISECTFEGLFGFSQRNGVQAKGGSQRILVERCKFNNAGTIAVKVGGHTGTQYFRPEGTRYEAKNIQVKGNRLFGSDIAIAWGTSFGGEIAYNTIVYPKRAVFRIYQGTDDLYFLPSQGGVFRNNIIVIEEKKVRMGIVDKGTLPNTFSFRKNVWMGMSKRRISNLPVSNESETYLNNYEVPDIESLLNGSAFYGEKFTGTGADSYRSN